MRIHYRIVLIAASFSALAFLVLSSCSSSDSLTQNSSTNPYNITNSSGMWMLPQMDGALHRLMHSQGLELSADAIYNPNTASLNRGVVRININQKLGGTGSFVSPDGLILTNQSVAYPALASASSSNKNYLKEGFYADSMTSEIPMPGYSLYITIKQKEVTDQINSQLADSLTYRQRLQQSQKIRKQLIRKRKRNSDKWVVEISDSWAGNRQFMSVYKVIRDVRLVHAPPESIASVSDYGWPRSNGDYAFLRAYVSPDGSGRTYHSRNIPFSPAKYFTIHKDEISNEDFTLVMGFPGQTSRHESSYALEFYHEQRNPIVIDSYQAILDGLEYAADQDPQTAIETADRRKSLKNTISYYKDLQQGIERQHIIEQKQNTEKKFEQWFKQDSLRSLHYTRVLGQLDQAYNIASQTGDLLHATVYTLNNCHLLQIASLYNSHWQLLEDSSKQEFSSGYKDSLLTRHQALLENINIEAQQITLSKMLYMLSTLPDGKVMFHLLELFGDAEENELKKDIDSYLQTQRRESIIYNPDRAEKFLSLPIDSARQKPADELVKLYRALLESYQFSKKNYVQYVAYQQPAQQRYIQGMIKFAPSTFAYPDANGTLRLSPGTISGYMSKDSVYQKAFSTLTQFSDKESNILSKLSSTSKDSLVINFLSTNDVTGGNAGSPVLNTKGELIGLTFDINRAGTANDYMYNPDISRTISISIKYILFLMDHFKTDRLIKEIMQPD